MSTEPVHGDQQPGEHQPRMSSARAEYIRQWHQERSSTPDDEQTFSYLGRTLTVPPQVMPINPVSDLLGRAVQAEVTETDRVLDMGTGSGVNAILAASKAAEVLAVDINPHALRTAKANVERNGVADRVEVRHSDIFDAVDGTFDLIVFDPPFRWFAPRNITEAATTDENYQALSRFFRQARGFLTPRGRMLMFFGTSGDMVFFQHLTEEAGFRRTVIAERRRTTGGFEVDYHTFRLTPQ